MNSQRSGTFDDSRWPLQSEHSKPALGHAADYLPSVTDERRDGIDQEAISASEASSKRIFFHLALLLFAFQCLVMLYAYGHVPTAPVIGDEVTINDPAIALSRGQGLVAPSFAGSVFALDKLYAHFPPLYIFTESLAFRAFGVSVYSLRLTTTVMAILSAAVFLSLLWYLCLSGLADWQTAAAGALLYIANACVIVLHRIARMESMVEFFCLGALFCVCAATRAELMDSPVRSFVPNKRASWLVIATGLLCGLAIATHPEAVVALGPMLLLVLLSPRIGWMVKSVVFLCTASTPAIIWEAAYGRRWREALSQMRAIARYNAPPPGIVSYGRVFLLPTHRNWSQAVRAEFFLMCLLVLGGLLVRWVYLERKIGLFASVPADSSRESDVLLLTRCFGLASLISLLLLEWFLSASITRYEVLFPIYVIGLMISLRGAVLSQSGKLWVKSAGVFLLLAQAIGIFFYFQLNDTKQIDSRPDRFDAVVDAIPITMRTAATPTLWLAFQQKDRPVTLIDHEFDGFASRRDIGNQTTPVDLSQFDAVILDGRSASEWMLHGTQASNGRSETVFRVGSDSVHLFLRKPR